MLSRFAPAVRPLAVAVGLLFAPCVAVADPAMALPLDSGFDPSRVAVDPSVIPETLTLDALIGIALVNNPTLRQSAAVVDAQRGRMTQVGLYPNPIVGYMGSEIGDNNTAGQQGGYIEQEFVTAKKLQRNRAVAAQDVNQALWLQEQQRYRIENAVRLRYYDLLGAQRRVEIAENLQITAKRAADASRQLREAGEGTRPDLLQAEIEVQQAEILLANAKNEYVASWKQLTSVLGVPTLEPVPLAGNLNETPPEYYWEETLAWLVANSPEIQAARTTVARAHAALDRACVEPIPNIGMQTSVQQDKSSGDTIVGVQVGVPVPVFNRNQGNIAAAHADLRRAQEETLRVELELRERLATAFRRYQNAKQQVDRYREEIIPRAQESLNLLNEGYRRGELSFVQVLFAQRTYFQTNMAYVEALTDLWQSSVTISGLLLTPESESGTVPAAAEPRVP